MKSAHVKALSTVGSIFSGIVLSAAIILLPVQGAIADNMAPVAPAKTSDKKMAKKPMKSMKKTAKHAPSKYWMKVQMALIAKGAKIKSDGYPGPATHKAIAAFQKSAKMKPTGVLDKATKTALGL